MVELKCSYGNCDGLLKRDNTFPEHDRFKCEKCGSEYTVYLYFPDNNTAEAKLGELFCECNID